MPDSQVVIETHGLRKVYGTKVAVDSLDLTVERGEVFGFLGPNGAGKSTTINMLLGLTRPTDGTAQLLGMPVGNWQVRARVGFLPEHFRFHGWLTAAEFLRVHGQLSRMARADLDRRIPELLDLVGLSDFAGARLETFSKGMLQRIGLAEALVNQPEVVFLDEPTSGLDPVGRRLVRDIITDLRWQGVTVFLNSHLLSEVEITCDRVAFIRRGKVVRTARLGDLESGTEVTLKVGQVTAELLAGLTRWGHVLQLEGTSVLLQVDSPENVPVIVEWLVGLGVKLYALTPRHTSLEELFFDVMEGETSVG
jgi:ABC-2 type transport system ATP-binding protein